MVESVEARLSELLAKQRRWSLAETKNFLKQNESLIRKEMWGIPHFNFEVPNTQVEEYNQLVNWIIKGRLQSCKKLFSEKQKFPISFISALFLVLLAVTLLH